MRVATRERGNGTSVTGQSPDRAALRRPTPVPAGAVPEGRAKMVRWLMDTGERDCGSRSGPFFVLIG